MSLRRNHLPGLDGLRALAVLSVVAYHLGYGWVRGGFLGVDLFFVLSGFLITSLLLEERLETGRLVLVEFWRRRARRLLPALFLMVAVVVAWPLIASFAGHGDAVANVDVGQLRGFGFASLFYYANWFVISSGHSYFATITAPSPLLHTWSLAIEEQFYLVWPLLTYVLARGGVLERRRRGVVVSGAIAIASSLLMVLLFHLGSGDSANYVYNASFTRLFDLAVGAGLAWLVVQRPATIEQRRWSDPVGLIALLVLTSAFYWAGTSQGIPTNFMFDGGFLLCAVLCALLISAVRVDGSWMARVFSLAPLRAIGRVSYGVYLWHWPVIVYVTPTSTGVGGKKLLLLRLVLLALTTMGSYFIVEKPIRERRWPVMFRRVVAGGGTIGSVAAVAVFTTVSLFPVSLIGPELTAYAPANPPLGSGGVIGHLDRGWIVNEHASVSHPLRILVIGDSIPYYSGGGISAALNALPNVVSQVAAFPDQGVRQRSLWPLFLNAINGFSPEIVIFIDHADEPDALAHPQQYEQMLQAFMSTAFAHNVQDFVLATTPRQHTPTGWILAHSIEEYYYRLYHQQNLAWRRAAVAAVNHFPGRAIYLPLHQSLEIKGQFVQWIAPPLTPSAPKSSWARVRMTDGIHMCPVGTEVYSEALTYDLSQALGIPGARQGWWNENWPYAKQSGRGDVALFCPNDHPPI